MTAVTAPRYGLADKGYDTNAVVERVEQLRAEVVTASKQNRLACRLLDRCLYRQRNHVERFFGLLKDFRLATCYEKTVASFLGLIHFFAALCWC